MRSRSDRYSLILGALRTFSLIYIGLLGVKASRETDIEIHAEKVIECHTKDNVCIAKGNAWAKRGNVTIYGDELRIFFDKIKGKRVVKQLEAVGNAQLKDPSGVVTSHHITYVMEGQTLHSSQGEACIHSPKFTLTAKKGISYSHQTHQGYAEGDVTFIQGDYVLRAQSLLAAFYATTESSSHDAEKEGLALRWAKANGKVCLRHNDQFALADQALYHATHEKAYLYGNVSILQGKQMARGQRGFFDFSTKRATLTQPLGKVGFLIFPKELKPLDTKNPK